jgi:chitinase domain-containing protein 1
MTYDMNGPGGRELRDGTAFPQGSPIRQAIAKGQAREPGPNTSASWVRDNLIAFVEASAAGAMDPSQSPAHSRWASRKFLMGMPLYGYKYPVVFVDRSTGDFVKRPSEGADSGRVMPILRGAGEPVIMTEILDMIKEKKAKVLKSEEDGEYFFDYEKRPGTGAWRVFLPTSESMSNVFDTIKAVVDDDLEYAFGGAGVALWEVGQSSAGLLASI